MLFLKKLSIYLLGLVSLYLFYLLLMQPEKIWHLTGGLAILLALVSGLIINKKLSLKEALIFFSFILLLLLVSVLFLLILENLYLKYVIIFIAPALIVFYFQLIFSYLYSPHKYQPFSLVNFFDYTSLIILFFSSTGLFTLNIFLNLSFWLTAAVLGVLAGLLMSYNFWLNKIEIKKYIYYPLIIFLLIFELSTLLTWWPINYYLKGFLITVFYFLFSNLANKNIKQVWNRKRVGWLVIIVLIIVLVSLVTGRWL